jgi:hypothetical protein
MQRSWKARFQATFRTVCFCLEMTLILPSGGREPATRAALFLASDVTGIKLMVDGGWMAG